MKRIGLMALSLLLILPGARAVAVSQQASALNCEACPTLAQRQRNLRALGQLAWHWREQAIPGVELWARLTAYAVTLYPEVPAPTRSDLIMQDLALVILGPAALKYLNWYDAITPEFWEDTQVQRFQRAFQQLNLPAIMSPDAQAWWSVGYAGKIDEDKDPGLDRHFGQDFRPELNDHSDNQIFHCFFYVYISYVSQAPYTVRWASLYHEFVDVGGSVPDHRAALVGIELGQLWRQWRETHNAGHLQAWPASLRLSFGRDPGLDNTSPELSVLRQKIEKIIVPEGTEAPMQALEFWTIRALNALPQTAPQPTL